MAMRLGRLAAARRAAWTVRTRRTAMQDLKGRWRMEEDKSFEATARLENYFERCRTCRWRCRLHRSIRGPHRFLSCDEPDYGNAAHARWQLLHLTSQRAPCCSPAHEITFSLL